MTRHRVHCRPCGPVACGLGQGRAVVLVVARSRPPSRRTRAKGHLLRWAAVLLGCLTIGGGC